jgi:hypothetical protein
VESRCVVTPAQVMKSFVEDDNADLGTTEIFLPSYADYHFDTELERRQDPVAEIIVTDEEVGRMFPE